MVVIGNKILAYLPYTYLFVSGILLLVFIIGSIIKYKKGIFVGLKRTFFEAINELHSSDGIFVCVILLFLFIRLVRQPIIYTCFQN